MLYFLYIRIKQFLRILIELGIIRSIFFLAFCVFVYFLHLKYYWLNNNIYVPLGYVFLISSIHFSRKDKKFLRLFFENPSILIFSEYIIISLPLLVLAILSFNWLHLLILLLFNTALSFFLFNLSFSFRMNIVFKYDLKLIEWYSGLRQNLLLLIVLNVISIFLYNTIGGLIIMTLLISFVLVSFFMNCESKELVETFAPNPSSFLFKKAKIHFLYSSIFVVIPMILMLIFNFEYYYVALIITLVFITLQLFAIYTKYALYEPGDILKQNSILHALFLIGFIFPFIFPIAIYFLFKYRNSALKNLKTYLNA